MNDQNHAHRVEELVGRLCWFSEPPGIRGIVRVLAIGPRPYQPRLIHAQIEVLASVSGWLLEPGSVHHVGRPRAGGYSCWFLYPLDAQTVDEAIAEVETTYPEYHGEWATTPSTGQP